ncbi:MAG: bifunctional UDP-N-acetylglucosamine diphosphorylase/glucosamine-1-phosphate N-acetyltransferase GlmU [Coriobacteriia bacterium]|nr:bifunctional UDP-N-acetylglucosamine diphosphorylase/glucosamine-1-phosphate N-acetyltransferase GlmU [Coriobacteriia bacterium]
MGVTALILAAGEGTRMKSTLPKVAHRILGVPMVEYVVTAVRAAGVERIVVVTGHGADVVESLLAGTDVEFARQDEQLGTGHAVMCALETVGELTGPVVVLAGDVPLIRAETVAGLVQAQAASGAACVVLSALFPDPTGYGRIVRDDTGSVMAIVEQKDLEPGHLAIAEGNAGIYCFDGAALGAHLHRLEASNAQSEYYLTDTVALMVAAGLGVEAVVSEDAEESYGVNSRIQLAEVAGVLRKRINEGHMLAGVSITDPSLAWIGPDVEIGRDTVVEPMTFLMGRTGVGEGCLLGPDTRITDSVIGAGCTVDSSIVIGSTLAARVSVGPRAYLRPGTVMAEGSKAGTSVEIKNSHVGAGSKVPHLSYIGDTDIGENANIGAGTITCNYDGRSKHRTVIGDGAFVGSDTMLIAPVEVGPGAVTGAGSAIAQDVPADALAVERTEQRTIEGWAAQRRDKGQGDE